MDVDKAKRALIRLQDVPNPAWSDQECELLGEAMDALFPGEEGRAECQDLRSEMGIR